MQICVVQIQPRKHALDHAGYTAPTRQHELDHTDHTDHTDQYISSLKDQDQQARINHADHTDHTDDLSEVWTVYTDGMASESAPKHKNVCIPNNVFVRTGKKYTWQMLSAVVLPIVQ